jgi:hypothetical protein
MFAGAGLINELLTTSAHPVRGDQGGITPS